jgi:DNA-binding CsgD family transcriptional regulator
VVAFTDLVPLETAQQMIRAVHGPGAPVDLVANLLVGPICGNGRVIGTLRLMANEPVSPATREIAHAVCTHTAVRLAELGLAGPDDAARLAQLTARQREVARLVARGRSTPGIADALAISPNTVKKHLKDIFEQLGVTSRAELAVVASRFGASIAELEAAHDDLIVVWREGRACN